jgi:hypothetical protein
MPSRTSLPELRKAEAVEPGDEILRRLERIEAALEALVAQRLTKDFFTTAESAKIFDRAEFTVREWCRNGRIRAEKRLTGRGRSKEWMISREEIERIQNEGLLPSYLKTRRPSLRRLLLPLRGKKVSQKVSPNARNKNSRICGCYASLCNDQTCGKSG